MATSQNTTVTLSKPVFAILATVAGLGVLGGTFALGLSTGSSSAASAIAGPVPPGTTTTTTTSAATPTGPFVAGQTMNFKTAVDTLQGQRTTLARGSKGTVIMAMASWCLYCAYEDKYVMPALAKMPGVVIDVVDVSPQGGIGAPGPATPAFSGHDGTGGALSVAGMESTMRQYVTTFGTLSAPNVHVYVAPSVTQTAWNIQSFPTLAFVGANGQVTVAPTGAQTLSQAQSDLQQALGT